MRPQSLVGQVQVDLPDGAVLAVVFPDAQCVAAAGRETRDVRRVLRADGVADLVDHPVPLDAREFHAAQHAVVHALVPGLQNLGAENEFCGFEIGRVRTGC